MTSSVPVVSYAIMAHPKRAHYVEALKQTLPFAHVVWDRVNDEWDTGRRAIESYNPKADWHVIVQDDAILCNEFYRGALFALGKADHGGPVSFYVGQCRPYGREVTRLVDQAVDLGRSWIVMKNGPIWGVCVALPTAYVPELLDFCDEMESGTLYDARMAGFFKDRGVATWYTIPSLVDHRDQAENPSLLDGHGLSSGRVAHEFIGAGSPMDIDWSKSPHYAGDPAMYWDREFRCTRCNAVSGTLRGAIVHAAGSHKLGPVDFLATTEHHARMLDELRQGLPQELVGEFTLGGLSLEVNGVRVDNQVRRQSIGARFRSGGSYVICGARRDFKHLGGRAGWSLDGTAN